MKIILHRVGLKTTPQANTLPLSVSGTLKSRISTRHPVHIRLEDGSDFSTGIVRRCGPGFLLTDQADYAVTVLSAEPAPPERFRADLPNVFTQEAAIVTEALDLARSGESLCDTPQTREIGYPEFISERLAFEINSQAESAAEGSFSTQDAQRVITASLSAQAADMLGRLHDVDFRDRLVAIPTSHACRGVDAPTRELNAVAVYARGKVIHCLSEELPMDPEPYCAHIVATQSLAAEGSPPHRRTRRATKRPDAPARQEEGPLAA